MFLRKILFLSLCTLFCLISVSFADHNIQDEKNQDTIAIAKIGDKYTVKFNDLRKYVFDWLYNRKYRDQKVAYKEALDAMVTNQLKRKDFFARGLNKDEKLLQSIRRIIGEEVAIEYYTTQYLNKYTNDEYAKKIYDIADRQVNYQRILLKFPVNNTQEKQKESLKKKAQEIRDAIVKGKDFRKLVKQYSQDSLSINANGSMPPVEWEQSLVDPLGKVIFNLKAGEVRILDLPDGIYIIKVVGVKKLNIKPFEQMVNEIKSKLKNIFAGKSLEEFQNDKEEIISENSAKWNNEALQKLVKWSAIPNFYLGLYLDTLRNAILKNNFTIVTYTDGEVDLREYLNLLNNVLLPRFAADVNDEDIKAYIVEAVQSKKIFEKAEKLGIEDKIFNVNTDNPVLKNQIVILYNQVVIDSQITKPTDAILHKFYNEQKDSLYHQLHKVNIYAMIYPEEKQAEEVMQKIKSGTPFEKISGSWSVKTFVRDLNNNIKSFLDNEEPFLGEAAMKLGLNETKGPIKYYDPAKGDQYAIIKCVNIRPEKQLLYNDVAGSISEDYWNYQRNKMMKEVRNMLWKKYDAKVFEDVLEKKLSSTN